jgi:hypothetical protein
MIVFAFPHKQQCIRNKFVQVRILDPLHMLFLYQHDPYSVEKPLCFAWHGSTEEESYRECYDHSGRIVLRSHFGWKVKQILFYSP